MRSEELRKKLFGFASKYSLIVAALRAIWFSYKFMVPYRMYTFFAS